MKTRGPVFRSIAFFLNGIILWNLTQRALPPEKVSSLWMAIPAFLVFAYFSLAMLSAGALVRTRLRLPYFFSAENGLVDLSLGTVFFYLLAYLLTPLGLFSSAHPFILWAILAILYGQGAEKIQYARWFDFAKSKWAKALLAVPLLILFLRVLESFQIPMHGDAYITYLPAPRMWAEQGNFRGFVHFSQFFLSTSYEALFAWGTALMGLKQGAGLDLSQYFSQWCVSGIALLGILLATLSLCKRLAQNFPLSDFYFPIIAVSALQIPALRWTANLAKNDMGVGFWGISAFYFTIFLLPISGTLAFFAGLITGAAVIGKLTLVILGICLGTYVLCTSPKRFIWFGLGGIAGGSSVFLRNIILTKNPVFPWLPTLFPNTLLSQSQIEAGLHPTNQKFLFSNLSFYLLEIQKELPLILVLLIILILLKQRMYFLKLISVPMSATLLYTFFLRASTEIRYQNANLILLSIFALFFRFNC